MHCGVADPCGGLSSCSNCVSDLFDDGSCVEFSDDDDFTGTSYCCCCYGGEDPQLAFPHALGIWTILSALGF